MVEIPTPRWTTFDAKALRCEAPEDVLASIRERLHPADLVHAGLTYAWTALLKGNNLRREVICRDGFLLAGRFRLDEPA